MLSEQNDLAVSCLNQARKIAHGFACISPEDREDLVSVAFLALVRASRVYDSSRGVKFTTLAHYVAINAVRNEKRRQSRGEKPRLRDDVEVLDRSSLSEGRNDFLALLPLAIRKLPYLECRLIRLRLRGLTPTQISRELGFGMHQYWIAYRSALEQLRQLLETM